MQITQLLLATGMALTATAVPIPFPGLDGFPQYSKIIHDAAVAMPQPEIVQDAAKNLPEPFPDPRGLPPRVKRGVADTKTPRGEPKLEDFKVIIYEDPDAHYDPYLPSYGYPQKRGGPADITIPDKWACPDDAKTPLGNGFEAFFRNKFGIPPDCGWPDEPFP